MKSLTKIIDRKALISWGYLVIAILLLLSTFIKTVFTENLYFLEYEHHQTGMHSGYTVSSLNLIALTIWLFAVLYLVHFIYGAFFYPQKYRDVLTKCYIGENDWKNSHDYSAFRGLIGTAGICIMSFMHIYSFYALSANSTQNIIFWVIAWLWVILNAWLSVTTSTYSLFSRSSVLIDRVILAPWEYDTSGEDEVHSYERLYFDYPSSENEEEWKQKVAYAFAKELQETEKKSKQENDEAERLSWETSKKLK